MDEGRCPAGRDAWLWLHACRRGAGSSLVKQASPRAGETGGAGRARAGTREAPRSVPSQGRNPHPARAPWLSSRGREGNTQNRAIFRSNFCCPERVWKAVTQRKREPAAKQGLCCTSIRSSRALGLCSAIGLRGCETGAGVAARSQDEVPRVAWAACARAVLPLCCATPAPPARPCHTQCHSPRSQCHNPQSQCHSPWSQRHSPHSVGDSAPKCPSAVLQRCQSYWRSNHLQGFFLLPDCELGVFSLMGRI